MKSLKIVICVFLLLGLAGCYTQLQFTQKDNNYDEELYYSSGTFYSPYYFYTPYYYYSSFYSPFYNPFYFGYGESPIIIYGGDDQEADRTYGYISAIGISRLGAENPINHNGNSNDGQNSNRQVRTRDRNRVNGKIIRTRTRNGRERIRKSNRIDWAENEVEIASVDTRSINIFRINERFDNGLTRIRRDKNDSILRRIYRSWPELRGYVEQKGIDNIRVIGSIRDIRPNFDMEKATVEIAIPGRQFDYSYNRRLANRLDIDLPEYEYEPIRRRFGSRGFSGSTRDYSTRDYDGTNRVRTETRVRTRTRTSTRSGNRTRSRQNGSRSRSRSGDRVD